MSRLAGAVILATRAGFVYTLEADNGDPASFRLDVTAGGVTTSFTVPWSTDYGFEPFVPQSVDAGF